MKNIFPEILRFLESGTPVALATVVHTRGSTPQKPGISALFSQKGLLLGTIGGGVLEGQIQELAAGAVVTGESGFYSFDLDTGPEDEGAVCGGKAIVLLDARPAQHLKAFQGMQISLQGRKPGGLVIRVKTPDHDPEIEYSWVEKGRSTGLPAALQKSVEKLLEEAVEDGFFSLAPVETDSDEHIYLEVVRPLPRLVIAGAGHVGRAVARMGNWLGFEVVVVDDREEFANPENLPEDHRISCGDIAATVAGEIAGDDTYVVIVTRGHRYDSDTLKACLHKRTAYIGMIGSRKKVAVVRENSIREGWAGEEDWKRIYSPIGLEIGSKTVEEIAVSIAAQLVQVRRQKTAAHG